MDSADLSTGCQTAEEPRWSVRGACAQNSAGASLSQGRLPSQRTPRSVRAERRKDPSIDTSGTPHVHEIRMERSEALCPEKRMASCPPQRPVAPSSRFLRCNHFQ